MAIVASDVESAFANHLKIDVSALTAYHVAFCTRGLTYASQEIKSRLGARGFRLAEDVALWDRLDEFTLDMACWKALVSSGAYSSIPPEIVKALDRAPELDAVLVFVGGVYVKPAMGQPGTITTAGPMAQDESGVFNWDATDRPGRCSGPGDLGFRW